MEITIQLRPDAYRSLLDHLPDGSSAQRALVDAVELLDGAFAAPIEYVVYCSEEDAQLIFETAREYCPSARAGIKQDIQISRYWSVRRV